MSNITQELLKEQDILQALTLMNRPHWHVSKGLVTRVEAHEEAPHLRASPFQGPRVYCTPGDALSYGLKLMDLRNMAFFDQADKEIKRLWVQDVTEFEYGTSDEKILFLGTTAGSVDVRTQVHFYLALQELADKLRVQVGRQQGHYHITADAFTPMWNTAYDRAVEILNVIMTNVTKVAVS